ncbi:TPA: hypothetical protein U2M23_003229 [Providencia stuartii]|nr:MULTISPECIES: hypothetical protein [Providencia]WIJ75429.1 hypothetical protein OI982_08185 [Providencia thailandensis]MCX3070245.1 hypothetical protein [Providencia stuartii]WIJ75506.1 hypothetical protein OI982_08575 [Providencia thailandensis]HEM7145878.1 hypothetical protein [Providencia stuartii]HEM8185962.1 hypothetical protein [Providencia stuartii]
MIEKPIYYMSAERTTIKESHFLLCFVKVSSDGCELLAEKKFAVKPTAQQIRKVTKFVMNHINKVE